MIPTGTTHTTVSDTSWRSPPTASHRRAVMYTASAIPTTYINP